MKIATDLTMKLVFECLMEENFMKLGIAGTGKVVAEFLPLVAELEHIEVTAINSTPRSAHIAKELQASYGIEEVYSNYIQFLEEADIDTVYVAVINNLHYDFVKDALQHGKHVICEKPFTMSHKELLDLEQLALDYDLVLAEAIPNQFLANYEKIIELLPQLGEIKLIECSFCKYSSRYDALLAGNVLPAFDAKSGGGALMDLNIYNIHFVLGLMGCPNEVDYFPNLEKGIDTSGVLVLGYENAKAVCTASKASNKPNRSIIQGTKGTIVVNGSTGRIESFDFMLNDGTTAHYALNVHPHKLYAEFSTIASWIDKDDTTYAEEHLAHSLTVMDVVDRAIQSAGLATGPFSDQKIF